MEENYKNKDHIVHRTENCEVEYIVLNIGRCFLCIGAIKDKHWAQALIKKTMGLSFFLNGKFACILNFNGKYLELTKFTNIGHEAPTKFNSMQLVSGKSKWIHSKWRIHTWGLLFYLGFWILELWVTKQNPRTREYNVLYMLTWGMLYNSDVYRVNKMKWKISKRWSSVPS